MANEYTLGQKLQGIGAALSGTVPQFQQQMLQLDEARIKAMYQDAGAAYQMLQKNNFDGIIDLADDRLRILRRIPGSDTSDTENVKRLTQQAKAGDNQAYLQLVETLGNAYNTGVSRGLTQALPVPKYLGTEEGMMLFQKPDGSIETKPISTDQEYVSPELKKEARQQARSGMSSVKSLSRDALEGYRKLEGLGDTIRAGQGEGATEQQKRAARQALATGLTIMARMASPGVVTEQDFRNLAGGSKVGTEFINALSNKDASIDNLLAAYDPTDPDKINVDMFIDQARSLLSGTSSTLLNEYAGLKTSAQNYNLGNVFMQAEFGQGVARNLGELGKLANPNFDQASYFKDPQAYLNSLTDTVTETQSGGSGQGSTAALDNQVVYNSREEAEQAANNLPPGITIFYRGADDTIKSAKTE